LRVNDQIRAREVRLITEDGAQFGVVPTNRAKEMAAEVGLDLVEISPNAVPPVAKILDWGKYRYEQQKQQQKQKAKQKKIEVKGIRLGIKISEHDLDTKLRSAEKFLSKEDKVKFQVRFKGREIAHKELGQDLLLKIAEKLTEVAIVEQPPTSLGRDMLMVMAPKKADKQAGRKPEEQTEGKDTDAKDQNA
jgi:translation initiation factor IF-3